jgi:ABC-type phosphonate transport system ATPase subunit
MKSLVEVAGLTKSYGRKRGVIELSFDVADGEVYWDRFSNGRTCCCSSRSSSSTVRRWCEVYAWPTRWACSR